MSWIRPLLITLELMAASSVIALVVGMAIAFALAQLDPARWTGRLVMRYVLVCSVTCLATPLILHAAAWEATAGKFGWMTFSQTAARTYQGFAGAYGGMVACAWVHGLFGSALVAMAIWHGARRVPADVLEQSRLDGDDWSTWWRIRIPMAAPWIFVSLLGVAMLAATEMTVVDLYGVRTLADEFYLFHAADPSMSSILMVLVLPAAIGIVAATFLATRRRRRLNVKTATGRAASPLRLSNATSMLSALVAVGLATLLVVFPAWSLVIKAGHQVVVQPGGSAAVDWSAVDAANTLLAALPEFAREYQWTMALSALTAMASVPAAMLLAAAARGRRKLTTAVDLASLLLFLIPGPMVGLAIVSCFSLPIPGFRFLYHSTLVPTVIALMVRALPLAYWVMRAGYETIDRGVFDTAALDLGFWQRLWRVDLFLLGRPLVIAFLATGILASGDVPATLPVIPPGVVTVGTRLFALLHSGARYQEAALAFWYLVAVVFLAMLIASNWKTARS